MPLPLPIVPEWSCANGWFYGDPVLPLREDRGSHLSFLGLSLF